MSLNEIQLHNRSNKIGGSDIAALLGVSPYKTPVQLWLEKTGQAQQNVNNKFTEWGNLLEPIVADYYQKVNNVIIKPCTQSIMHREHNFMIANPDYFDITNNNLIEIKTSDKDNKKQWFNDNGEITAPLYVQLQCYWYLAMLNKTEIEYCDIAVLFGGNDYHQLRLNARFDVQSTLINKVKNWWHKHVINSEAPQCTNIEDIFALFKTDNDLSIDATEELQEAIFCLKKYKNDIAELEAKYEDIKFKIQLAMKDASSVIFEDKPLITWRQGKDKTVIDYKSLVEHLTKNLAKDEKQVLVASFTIKTPGNRTFLIK